MNILIINGPNLNMLGKRDAIYGSFTYEEMCRVIQSNFKFKLDFFQSNFEGEIIEKIHHAVDNYDALIINPAAFTHYSYAIADALEIFNGVKVEVHLTNINEREDFRKISVVKDVCNRSFMGKGIDSYIEAVNFVKDNFRVEKYFETFKKSNSKYNNASYVSSFYFHYEESVTNELLQLVIEGEKKAISSAFPLYEIEGEQLPKVGELSIVTDFAGYPKCIIEVVKVTVLPFKDITFDLCKKEGEDDSLESWRRNHIESFTHDSKAFGFTFNEDMKVVFEEFEVIYN